MSSVLELPPVDLEFVEGNDSTIRFRFQRLRAGGIIVKEDLTGAAVELFIKDNVAKLDTDVGVIKYSIVSGEITVVAPATDGVVDVAFKAADIGGLSLRWYHLDVVKSARRQTFFYGEIRKVDV